MTDEIAARKFPFVVNNNSNEVAIEKAVVGLRNMVELGRRAQVALDALERDGYYDKNVIWAENTNYDKNYPSLRKGKFPAFVRTSREDLACMSTLSLSLGNGARSQYGGHSCVEYVVILSGEGVCDVKGQLRPNEIRGIVVGTLRVSGKTISWVEGNSAWKITTRMRKIEPMLEKAKTARDVMHRMSLCMRNAVVGHANDQAEFTQRGGDLFKNVSDWLVDGGHVERMLLDILRAYHVLSVMED